MKILFSSQEEFLGAELEHTWVGTQREAAYLRLGLMAQPPLRAHAVMCHASEGTVASNRLAGDSPRGLG